MPAVGWKVFIIKISLKLDTTTPQVTAHPLTCVQVPPRQDKGKKLVAATAPSTKAQDPKAD